MVSTMFGSRIELAPSDHDPGGSWLTGMGRLFMGLPIEFKGEEGDKSDEG
jgi:hypothetical protein